MYFQIVIESSKITNWILEMNVISRKTNRQVLNETQTMKRQKKCDETKYKGKKLNSQ